MKNPLFLFQDTLERMISQQKVTIAGDDLTVTDSGVVYTLTPAVKILACEKRSDDPCRLVDKYIATALLDQAGADIYISSITYCKYSYLIEHGFICRRHDTPPSA
jgi:hypothetical protein